MNRLIVPFLSVCFLLILVIKTHSIFPMITGSGAPPYLIEDLIPPPADRYAWLDDWVRPDGPPKVGLQVGHWKNEELPEELSRLKGSTGSTAGGKSEWEASLVIAQNTKKILEERNILVDILPATIPQKYWADVFVSIHADGSEDWSKSGFKIASPRRDYSGKAGKLVDLIEESYEKATGLEKDPNITRNMRGYYAFAWWRYNHAVHPKTASAILETGFLTNYSDRQLLVNNSQLSAEGLASGIINFLESEKLLSGG